MVNIYSKDLDGHATAKLNYKAAPSIRLACPSEVRLFCSKFEKRLLRS